MSLLLGKVFAKLLNIKPKQWQPMWWSSWMRKRSSRKVRHVWRLAVSCQNGLRESRERGRVVSQCPSVPVSHVAMAFNIFLDMVVTEKHEPGSSDIGYWIHTRCRSCCLLMTHFINFGIYWRLRRTANTTSDQQGQWWQICWWWRWWWWWMMMDENRMRTLL